MADTHHEKSLVFNQTHELKVLHIVFHMFKYGISDPDKKLEVICSPVFRNMFNQIRSNYVSASAEEEEYIEDHPFELQAMHTYFAACREMVDHWEDMSWQTLSENQKRELVINLASPFSIREATILAMLTAPTI